MRGSLLVVLLGVPALVHAQLTNALNPQIKAAVEGISQERITATLQHLETFGTRNLLSSDTDPEHGIGAARRWIAEQFRSCSPRLQVQFDSYRVKKHGRIVHDVELNNVVAILPGARHPERQVIVSGHYDSIVMVKKPAGEVPADAELSQSVDWEKTAETPIAPGVTDDGSGVAVVLELARVLSQQQFDATLVFVAFSGEEEGLIGSTLYATRVKAAGENIEAVLNNDIVGSEVSGNGQRDNRAVNLYSADPGDSLSRMVARYTKEIAERYQPEMKVNLVFRADRFARGGDQTPFEQAGYAAVRLTTTAENFANQHTVTDTFANTSPSYTTLVAKVNAAAAASLAIAPAPPITTREVKGGEQKGRRVPNLSRGKSGYDAVLRWTPGEKDADLLGYSVLMRSTLSPFWEKEVFVGNLVEYTLPNVSIDDVVFGVRAFDKQGDPSPVSAYVMVTRPLDKVETY